MQSYHWKILEEVVETISLKIIYKLCFRNMIQTEPMNIH